MPSAFENDSAYANICQAFNSIIDFIQFTPDCDVNIDWKRANIK